MEYPIILRTVAARIDQLAREEYGSWEDAGYPTAGQIGYADSDGSVVEHAYVILTRHVAKIELRDAAESMLILEHVLQNSISKAESNANFDHRDDISWLRWIIGIDDRIRQRIT